MSRIGEVLAALREERQNLLQEVSRIDRAIEALEDAAAPAAAAQSMAAERQPGRYSMLDLCGAAFAYLEAVGEPQSSRQIADALRAGGFRTFSQNFTNTVRTMLRRPSASRYGIRKHSDGKRFFVES